MQLLTTKKMTNTLVDHNYSAPVVNILFLTIWLADRATQCYKNIIFYTETVYLHLKMNSLALICRSAGCVVCTIRKHKPAKFDRFVKRAPCGVNSLLPCEDYFNKTLN